MPAIAGGAVVIVIGLILLVAGAVQVARGLKAEAWTEKILATVMDVITVLAGILVIGHPLLGLAYLTLLLVAYFVAEGIWKLVASFRYRPATGVLSLILGKTGSEYDFVQYRGRVELQKRKSYSDPVFLFPVFPVSAAGVSNEAQCASFAEKLTQINSAPSGRG